MNTRWAWLVPAVLAAGLGHAQSTITREGNHWIETVGGSMVVEARLKVTTRGVIVLRGEDRKDVAYTIKKRARAANERAARELLSKIVFKSPRVKGWTVLEVHVPPYYDEAADVVVRAPKRLVEAALESDVGAVEAYDLDGGLFAKTGAGQIQLDRIGGVIKSGTGGGDIRMGKVAGPVKAVSGGGSIAIAWLGGDAYLETAGGEIVVNEATGRVQASARSGGNIRIGRAGQGVMVGTGGGVIDLSRIDGPVRANAGTGAIKVRGAQELDLTSGGGQIQLQDVHGLLQATTAMGSIIVELAPGKSLRDSMLTAQSGDITVYIPSNFPVTIEATNVSPGGHRIVSDFPEIRPRLAGGNLRSEANGAINGGGATLRLIAQGGTIYLRRRK